MNEFGERLKNNNLDFISLDIRYKLLFFAENEMIVSKTWNMFKIQAFRFQADFSFQFIVI